MELHEIVVESKQSLTLPFEEVQLMPIGDVQLGSDGVQLDRLRAQIAWAKDQGNVYFLGMGDYIDVMSPSNRAAWKALRKYDSVEDVMDAAAADLTNEFLRVVAGTEGRWLGILEGHHYYEFQDGTTSDTRIASSLSTKFLGNCAFVRMVFQRNKGIEHCTVWCHHGAGSGIMPHSPLNKLYHIMNFFDADIYAIGHQTKKPVVKVPRIMMLDNGKVVTRNKVLVGTGGFSEGYVVGSRRGNRAGGTYVEKGMMSPVYLGSPLIKIRPVAASGDRPGRIDLNVEI